MKTSNKLLGAVVCITLMAMLGSNLKIQAAYRKIKINDLFPGYHTQIFRPFRVLVLKGNRNGFVEIQPGKNNAVKVHPYFEKLAKSTIHGDTLEVTLIYPKRNNFTETNMAGFGPTLHIDATNLEEVISTDISYKIKGLRTSDLKLSANGGYTLLDSTFIENLNAVYEKESILQLNENNTFGKTDIQVRDKSQLNVRKNVFTSLKMDIDSSAQVSLPGNLLYTLMKKQ